MDLTKDIKYKIVFSEKELNAVISSLGVGYHYATDELLSAYHKLKEAKSKSCISEVK